jgi:hypothetical protein
VAGSGQIGGDSEFVDGHFRPTGPLSRSSPVPGLSTEDLQLQHAIRLSTQEAAGVVTSLEEATRE